ncbi:MAG TPA: hypothetical protein VF384_19890 [Planctomycetota bacterium]
MTYTSRVVASALALAVVVPAQLIISDGNMNVVTGTLPATQVPTTFDLRGDTLALDHGFEHSWFFRIAGDTREWSLRNVGPVTQGVTATSDHLDRDLADVDSRGLLRASIDVDVYDAGPASGVVISRLTVMNISVSPITVDLFCYTDLDIANTTGNDAVTGTGSSHFVTDSTGVRIEVRAIGNDRSDCGAYPTIRNLLTNASLDNLGNGLPPFSGDYTGAFQWQNRTLAPFQQRTFNVLIAIDTAAAAPPHVEHYGAGNGALGEIHTQTLPLQDNSQVRVFSLGLKNAAPNQVYRTLIGFAPFFAPVIPGLELWVDPFQLFGVWGIGGLTSPTGSAIETFSIPASPYLTGLAIYSQSFYVSASAPNGYAFYTPGLMTRIGKL